MTYRGTGIERWVRLTGEAMCPRCKQAITSDTPYRLIGSWGTKGDELTHAKHRHPDGCFDALVARVAALEKSAPRQEDSE